MILQCSYFYGIFLQNTGGGENMTMKKVLGRIVIVLPAVLLQALWYLLVLGLLNCSGETVEKGSYRRWHQRY